jgi:predicted transcriptional regulator YdeE
MAEAKNAILPLTTTPETTLLPEKHYVFIEKVGPFMTNAPQAWQDVHKLIPELVKQYTITGYFSLYKVESQIYRAGVSLEGKPDDLPMGLTYEKFPGGKYAKFTLTGSYSNLAAACGRAFQIAQGSKLPLRDDFNVENYVNDPRITPEDQLITEIMFPVA